MADFTNDDERMRDCVDGLIVSMYDGDLMPLARFIRDGGSIDGRIAEQISYAIRGLGPVKLVTKKTGGDRRSWTVRQQEISLQIKMGALAYKRLHDDPGLNFDIVCADVAKHFQNEGEKASRAVVAAALSKYRKFAEDSAIAFGDVATWWMFGDDLYRASAESPVAPNPKRRVRRSKVVK